MIPVILGFDPQLTRLGWAAVAVDDGRVMAAGCEPLDIKDGGWLHQQMHRALTGIEDHACSLKAVAVLLAREEPMKFGRVKSARQAGEAVGVLEAVAGRYVWPYLDTPVPFMPNEWKAGAGLPGNASKQVVMAWARDLFPGVTSQDAADAIGVARAAYETMEVEA